MPSAAARVCCDADSHIMGTVDFEGTFEDIDDVAKEKFDRTNFEYMMGSP